MILDKGIINIYRTINTSQPGNLPEYSYEMKHQAYYGELDYGNNPYAENSQLNVEVAQRVRILQTRTLSVQDIADISGIKYSIIRVYHGVDDDNNNLITDISLAIILENFEVMQP